MPLEPPNPLRLAKLLRLELEALRALAGARPEIAEVAAAIGHLAASAELLTLAAERIERDAQR